MVPTKSILAHSEKKKNFFFSLPVCVLILNFLWVPFFITHFWEKIGQCFSMFSEKKKNFFLCSKFFSIQIVEKNFELFFSLISGRKNVSSFLCIYNFFFFFFSVQEINVQSFSFQSNR
jgi:hypothetical protein